MCKTILTLLAALFLTTTASAQTAEVYFQPSPPIQVGDEIRIRLTGEPETWVSGNVLGHDFQTIEVDVSGVPLTLSMSQVEEMQILRRTGSHAGTGAGIGALVAGTAGLALGIAMANDDFFDVGGGAVFGATLLAAAGGALVGGLIGAAIPDNDWVNIDQYPLGLGVAPDGSRAVSVSLRF